MSNFGNSNKGNGGGFLGYRYFIDAAQKWRDNKKYNKQYKNARNNKSEAFRMESEYITNSFNDIRNLVEKHYNDNKIVKDDKKIVLSIVNQFLEDDKKKNSRKDDYLEDYGIKENLMELFKNFIAEKYKKINEEVKEKSHDLLEAYIDNKGEKSLKELLKLSGNNEISKLIEDYKVIRKALGILKKYIKNSVCFKDFLKKQNMNEGWGWLDNKYSVNNNNGSTDNTTMFNQLDYYCKLVVYFANSDYNWFQQHGNKADYFKQCFENQLNLINRLQENFNVYSTNLHHNLNNQQSNYDYPIDDGGSDDSQPHNQNNSPIFIGGSDDGYNNTDEVGSDSKVEEYKDEYDRRGLRFKPESENGAQQVDMTFDPESKNDTQQVDMTFDPEDTSGTMSDSQNNNNRGKKDSNLSKAKERFQKNQNNNRNRTGGRNRWKNGLNESIEESVDYIVDDCIRQFILENKKDNR